MRSHYPTLLIDQTIAPRPALNPVFGLEALCVTFFVPTGFEPDARDVFRGSLRTQVFPTAAVMT